MHVPRPTTFMSKVEHWNNGSWVRVQLGKNREITYGGNYVMNNSNKRVVRKGFEL